MADIDIERKRNSGTGWLWWAVGLLALVLIVWWVWPDTDAAEFADVETEQVTEPTAEVQPMPAAEPATGEQGDLTIAQIMENPGQYAGQDLSTSARVTEVPTDRGFWVEENGQRLFAVIIDQPTEQPKDVNPNTSVRLDPATVRAPSYLAELPGAPLDEQTEQIARDEDFFLVVNESDLQLGTGQEMQPAGMQDGTMDNQSDGGY